MKSKSINGNSLSKLADRLVLETQQFIKEAKSEEDLRIAFEKILEPVLKELGIKPSPRYERSIFEAGRPDALHGQVVIEYEPPFAFRSQRAINHAHDQLVGYIQGLSQSKKETLFLFEAKFIGVGFDGNKIFFTRYVGEKNKAKKELKKEDFILIGPYDFDENSARTLLTHLRALSRLPLNAHNLAQKFGPQSELATKAVSAFADALEYWGGDDSNRVRGVFFKEWKRLFGIVYGEQFSGSQQKEAEALSKSYKVGKETDFQELLFSVHTYFAFLMKLIAAELLALRDISFSSSLALELAHAPDEELKEKLADIEEGGIYTRRGITNFLEGDFFRWYLDAWSPRLKEVLQEITRALSEFEPATSTLDPASTRDLLKKLYQYLVPQEIRHRLGEYYTPDWLAELLIKEVGYDGNTLKRFLDPACGSGTFLVLAIQKAKDYAKEKKEPPLETAKRIVHNIWGFDLNPLAVIASRTNYLFALGDLVSELQNIEIPIYLADSALWPRQTGQMQLVDLPGNYVIIKTSVKEFHVPSIWTHDKGLLMKIAAQLIENFAKNDYDPKIAMQHFKKEGLVFPPHEKEIENFYKEILELEREKKNGIWARFLKNAFAPMVAGKEKFDFVVGNPPWIRWGYLSKEYREATLQMWKDYGLFSLKGHAARLGGGEKDFSMLFTYASADYYLKENAKLGFLITQEVFKSKGAGEGFRRFVIGDKTPLKIIAAHDLVQIQPFEGAANKTAAIILKKGQKTTYPVPYIIWTRKKGVGKIPTEMLLAEALPLLQKKKLSAKPIGSPTGSWQTVSAGNDGAESFEGNNAYKARQGADPQPYGVFLVEIINAMSDENLIIRNLSKSGKFKVQQVEEKIESDLIYPALRGSDIKRWNPVSKIFILMTQDPQKREPYSENNMKNEWPRTYNYLTKFKDILLSRSSKSISELAKRTAFYAMFGIGPYTMSRYKVVWKLMSNDIIAAVVSDFKTTFGFKKIIPIKTVAMYSVDNEAEAHFLCSIMNSSSIRDFIKSFSSAGRGFGTPSVMEHVGIPKFDPKNKLHQKLAEISKKCHRLKAEGKEVDILEKENDDLVKKLFQIPLNNKKPHG